MGESLRRGEGLGSSRQPALAVVKLQRACCVCVRLLSRPSWGKSPPDAVVSVCTPRLPPHPSVRFYTGTVSWACRWVSGLASLESIGRGLKAAEAEGEPYGTRDVCRRWEDVTVDWDVLLDSACAGRSFELLWDGTRSGNRTRRTTRPAQLLDSLSQGN